MPTWIHSAAPPALRVPSKLQVVAARAIPIANARLLAIGVCHRHLLLRVGLLLLLLDIYRLRDVSLLDVAALLHVDGLLHVGLLHVDRLLHVALRHIALRDVCLLHVHLLLLHGGRLHRCGICACGPRSGTPAANIVLGVLVVIAARAQPVARAQLTLRGAAALHRAGVGCRCAATAAAGPACAAAPALGVAAELKVAAGGAVPIAGPGVPDSATHAALPLLASASVAVASAPAPAGLGSGAAPADAVPREDVVVAVWAVPVARHHLLATVGHVHNRGRERGERECQIGRAHV